MEERSIDDVADQKVFEHDVKAISRASKLVKNGYALGRSLDKELTVQLLIYFELQGLNQSIKRFLHR